MPGDSGKRPGRADTRPDVSPLGAFIQEQRAARRLSREQLAADANMSISSLRWHEHGWRHSGTGWVPVRPTEKTLRSLAAALSIPFEELSSRCGDGLSPGRRKVAALRLAAVFPSTHGDTFWALITDGLLQALPAPWVVMTFATGEDRETERAVLEQIAELGSDALVIAPAMAGAWPGWVDPRGRHPIVVIDRRPPGRQPEHVDTVLVTENRTAVAVAARRLIEKGRVQRLACLAGPLELSCQQERFDAVKEVLSLLWPTFLAQHDYDWAPKMERADVRCAEDAMNRLFLRPDDQLPDGVICLNGKMTVGALMAIRAHRKRIPEDMRFVGYDDGLWDCGLACAEPPPSLIRQDPQRLGFIAGRCVLSHRDSGRTQAPAYVEAARFEPSLGGIATCDALLQPDL